MRGKLLVLEGAEGVGKSTQVRLLAQWLESRGEQVTCVREPGGTAVGDAIRRILLDSHGHIEPTAEALLFMASRAALVEEVIRPALTSGGYVIADRFFLSTYAYQVAGRGVDESAVRQANALATRQIIPHLTLLLTLAPGEGLRRAAGRGNPDRIERSGDDFHTRVARAFEEFATEAWQAKHPECGPIVRVDASGSEEEVSLRLRAACVETLVPT